MPLRTLAEIESIESLADIFELTASLFDQMFFSWDEVLFEANHGSLLRDAWVELKEASYEDIYSRLRDPEDIREQMILEGLWTGQNQLRLKVFSVNESWKKFKNNTIVKLLKALLEFINAILKSLKLVIPGVGAWDEVKNIAEAWLKKWEGILNLTPA